jgi:hypothetical protein
VNPPTIVTTIKALNSKRGIELALKNDLLLNKLTAKNHIRFIKIVYHKESYKIVNKTQEKEDVKELTKENFSWFLGNKRERKNKCDPKGRTYF